MSDDYKPKTYFENGATLDWGRNLTKDEIERMENGEIFILNDAEGKPLKKIFKDSFGQFRESVLNNPISPNALVAKEKEILDLTMEMLRR